MITKRHLQAIAQRIQDDGLPCSKAGIIEAVQRDNAIRLELLNRETKRSQKAFATAQYLTYMEANKC